jgi:hypothetical protein
VLVLVAALAQGGAMGMVAFVPAAAIAIGGLLLVAQGQLLQAVITTANRLTEIRDLLRTQRIS